MRKLRIGEPVPPLPMSYKLLVAFNIHRFVHPYTGCPTRYQTRQFFNNFTTNEDIATKFEADCTSLCKKREKKNVPLFKFRCNICIGVRIIKEMTSSVESGTPCIFL